MSWDDSANDLIRDDEEPKKRRTWTQKAVAVLIRSLVLWLLLKIVIAIVYEIIIGEI